MYALPVFVVGVVVLVVVCFSFYVCGICVPVVIGVAVVVGEVADVVRMVGGVVVIVGIAAYGVCVAVDTCVIAYPNVVHSGVGMYDDRIGVAVVVLMFVMLLCDVIADGVMLCCCWYCCW